MKLYIGGYEIELSDKTKIAQTKQANDLTSLNTRQANYTNRFKVPLTDNNVKAFRYLGVIGNNSNVPYERSDTYLYDENGLCFLYNGYSVIKSTNKDYYDVNVYDGNVDLYKQIENKKLSDLDLSEITHAKNLTNVVDSFTAGLDYKYILADYNGKALYDTNKINIDYLVPSVSVKYIWDKIFSTYGFTYTGSYFDGFDFQNLWMTYPKGILSVSPDVDVYSSIDVDFEEINPSTLFTCVYPYVLQRSTFLKQNSNTLNDLVQIFDNRHFKVDESGNYRIEITGEIRNFAKTKQWVGAICNVVDTQIDCSLWLGKNSEGVTNSDNVSLITQLDPLATVLNINEIVSLNENESICFVLVSNNSNKYYNHTIEDVDLTLDISRLDDEIINFDEAFIDLGIKDFINEVLFRGGLTPFKDKFSNNYNFLTTSEILQTQNIIDWSAENNKFSDVISESYIYGSYAQQNVFKHKYNDSNDDYYDGYININNVNLEASRNAISSKIYVPEEQKTTSIFFETNVYKLWDKEPKDDGTTTYKPLSKRFYFLRESNKDLGGTYTIGSEQLGTDTTITEAPFESFFGLNFDYIVQKYYSPLSTILNRSKVITANIFLTDTDVSNINLAALYYIKQLNGYFMLNKLINYVGRGKTKCELIKVNYTNNQIGFGDIILNIKVKTDILQTTVSVLYNNSAFSGSTVDYVLDGGAAVTVPNDDLLITFNMPVSFPPISRTIYLTDGTVTSETKTFLA